MFVTQIASCRFTSEAISVSLLKHSTRMRPKDFFIPPHFFFSSNSTQGNAGHPAHPGTVPYSSMHSMRAVALEEGLQRPLHQVLAVECDALLLALFSWCSRRRKDSKGHDLGLNIPGRTLFTPLLCKAQYRIGRTNKNFQLPIDVKSLH